MRFLSTRTFGYFLVAASAIGSDIGWDIGWGNSAAHAQIRAMPTNQAVSDRQPFGQAAHPLGDFDVQRPDIQLTAGEMPMPSVVVSTEVSVMGDPRMYALRGRMLRAATWDFRVLPSGQLFPAYMAAGRESRIAGQWVYERDTGWLWDVTLGGRVGILRFGPEAVAMPTTDASTYDGAAHEEAAYPVGMQLDIEGAAFPRLSLDRSRDMISSDFRFGMPLTFRPLASGIWETKLGYYHMSSHLADEFIEDFGRRRINYVRDTIVCAIAVRPRPTLRVYAEVGYAFYTDDGSMAWEFQFGADWAKPGPTGLRGTPFAALNCRIRQEVDYGGNLTAQAGWLWRGRGGPTARFGAHYFNGKSDQYQFFRTHEDQIGLGIWYDY